jgi:hypothetical protein
MTERQLFSSLHAAPGTFLSFPALTQESASFTGRPAARRSTWPVFPRVVVPAMASLLLVAGGGLFLLFGRRPKAQAPAKNEAYDQAILVEQASSPEDGKFFAVGAYVLNAVPARAAEYRETLSAPHSADFVPLPSDELRSYYGAKVLPGWLPADLNPSPRNERDCGVYRRDKGVGEVYRDQNVFHYAAAGSLRSVSVYVAKGSVPLFLSQAEWTAQTGNLVKSRLSGAEVLLSRSAIPAAPAAPARTEYYADFVAGKAGFGLVCRNLTEEEFLAVLRSLLA